MCLAINRTTRPVWMLRFTLFKPCSTWTKHSLILLLFLVLASFSLRMENKFQATLLTVNYPLVALWAVRMSYITSPSASRWPLRSLLLLEFPGDLTHRLFTDRSVNLMGHNNLRPDVLHFIFVRAIARWATGRRSCRVFFISWSGGWFGGRRRDCDSKLNQPLASTPLILSTPDLVLLAWRTHVSHSHLFIREKGKLKSILPLLLHMALLVCLHFVEFVGRNDSSI